MMRRLATFYLYFFASSLYTLPAGLDLWMRWLVLRGTYRALFIYSICLISKRGALSSVSSTIPSSISADSEFGLSFLVISKSERRIYEFSRFSSSTGVSTFYAMNPGVLYASSFEISPKLSSRTRSLSEINSSEFYCMRLELNWNSFPGSVLGVTRVRSLDFIFGYF